MDAQSRAGMTTVSADSLSAHERRLGTVPLARLNGKDFEYIIKKNRTVIGRTSSLCKVDVSMGNSSFISREHVELICKDSQFFMSCLGKNGVFVGDVHCRKGAPATLLPPTCVFRFPSTNIRIMFESYVKPSVIAGESQQNVPQASLTVETNRKSPDTVSDKPRDCRQVIGMKESQEFPMGRLESLDGMPKPIFVNIPSWELKRSPCSSPTGTISAANSCPSSPRSQSYVPLQPKSLANKYAGHRDPLLLRHNIECLVPGNAQKPPYSYAQLIVQAISLSADRQLSLSGIYSYITRTYPFYRTVEKGWQNSIRHNLSLNRYFMKISRSRQEPGKGSFWKIDPLSEEKLVEQAFRKRRQKGFRTPYGGNSTRSAPTSPNHLTGGNVQFIEMHTLRSESEDNLSFYQKLSTAALPFPIEMNQDDVLVTSSQIAKPQQIIEEDEDGGDQVVTSTLSTGQTDGSESTQHSVIVQASKIHHPSSEHRSTSGLDLTSPPRE